MASIVSVNNPKNKPQKNSLSIFLQLSKRLLSNDPTKNKQRRNLSKKISSTILNQPVFLSCLKLPINMSNNAQLNSTHYKVCEICIQLLQHKDFEIHNFGKELFNKLINNNAILTNIMINLIFKNYVNVMPKTLMNTNKIERNDIDILSKLRAAIVIINKINKIYNIRSNNQQLLMILLNKSFKTLTYTLISNNFQIEPYKLPSLKMQILLIQFWSKHPGFVVDNTNFRTLYLLRWFLSFPVDFENTAKYQDSDRILNKLLKLITLKFNNDDQSDKSESVLMLYSILGFLGKSSISKLDLVHNIKINYKMLYKVLERIPTLLINKLNENLYELITELGSNKFVLIISRMLEFPLNEKIYIWILFLFKNLVNFGYRDLLREITVKYIHKIAIQIKEPDLCFGALKILKYLLLGYRNGPEPFHQVIGSLIESINVLKMLNNNNNNAFYYNQLADLIELCYALRFIWPGYPDKYYALTDILHKNRQLFPPPDNKQLRVLLVPRWTRVSFKVHEYICKDDNGSSNANDDEKKLCVDDDKKYDDVDEKNIRDSMFDQNVNNDNMVLKVNDDNIEYKTKYFMLQKQTKNEIKELKSKLIQSEKINNNLRYKLENNNKGNIGQCLICMDNIKCYICIPCGHVVCCDKCKHSIKGKCPICRGNCTIHKMYF